jgi:hypothetical protein
MRPADMAAARLITTRHQFRPINRRFVNKGGATATLRWEAAVDGSRFDSLTRLVGGPSTRRNTLRSALGVAASTLAVVGLAALSGEADAKKRKRCKRCKRCAPQVAGSLCTTNQQCCTNETNRICSVAQGSSSTTICCGGTGAACTSNENCCRHFSCVVGFCRP